MKKLALASWEHGTLTGIALLLFLSVFIGVVIWVFRKSSKSDFEKAERLPLEH